MHHCGDSLKNLWQDVCTHLFGSTCRSPHVSFFIIYRVFFFGFFLGSIYVRRERPAGDAELMEELADGQTDGGDQ